jgi:hypothetical protein
MASLCLLAGCNTLADIWGPSVPPYAQRFTPDTSYLRLWKETEACSGVRGRFGRVRWYSVPGDTLAIDRPNRGQYKALHQWPHDIYLTESVVDDAMTIRHEILHDLLGEFGDGTAVDHPRKYFKDRCGEWVAQRAF